MILLFPIIKLSIISNHYELYGTYIIDKLPEDKRSPELTARVKLKTQKAQFNVKGIRVTNILYYENLPQLSFGFISDKNSDIYYEIKIVDESQNEIGKLKTSGTVDFYNKSLERLFLNLDQSLDKRQVYTILITDKNRNSTGAVEFKYE